MTTLALTVACAVSVIVSRRLRPALVPLGLGVILLLVSVLLNADRARYYHSAEPFLLLTYAAGLWGIALALRSGWQRLRPSPTSGGILRFTKWGGGRELRREGSQRPHYPSN